MEPQSRFWVFLFTAILRIRCFVLVSGNPNPLHGRFQKPGALLAKLNKPNKMRNRMQKRYITAEAALKTGRLLMALAMCEGCLLQPSSGNEAADASIEPGSLRDQRVTRNSDVPVGCSRVWSTAKSDSILY